MRLLTFLLLAASFFFTPNALQAITFVGGYEGNIWTDYRNWAPQQVPGAGDLADVPLGTAVYVNGQISVGSLILGGGLNSDGNPNSSLTINSSFSWTSGSVGVPVTLIQGCSGLWQGSLGMGANITNYGQVSCDASVTMSYSSIVNYGEFDVTGAHTFGVYYSPASFENHGLLKKPSIDPSTFSIGVLLANYADGDILVENGELYASIHCQHSGDVNVLAGAVFHTHTLDIYNPATFSGGGAVSITGNGATAFNTLPVTFDNAETSMSANGIGGSGALIFPHHFTGLGGSIQAPVTVSPTGVVDINPGSGVGISNNFINNGTFNINANLTFSAGQLDNYGTIALTGAYTIGVYYASSGIFNYGTVQKTAASSGLFNMGIPLHNESGALLSVLAGELYCGDLYNAGDVTVAAGARLSAHGTNIYDGATFTGAGTYRNEGNGIYAANTANVTVAIEEVEIASNVSGPGPITFTGHLAMSNGGFNNNVTLAAGSVTDMNSGNIGVGGGTTTVYGTLNVNANFTLSGGQIDNYGLMSLNGPYTIGIYYGTPGIFNHGTVLKPAGSAGTYNMGVTLTNYADGQVTVENGELYVGGGVKNQGNISVSAGAVLRVHSLEVFDGSGIAGNGTLHIQGNGLYASNSTDVTLSIATVEMESGSYGASTIIYSGNFRWLSGSLGSPWVIAAGGVLDVLPGGNHGNSGLLTVNGTMNANDLFYNNGTLQNNGTVNLNATGAIGGYGQFNNAGFLKKNPAAANVTFTQNLNNTGTVQGLSDNFNFQGAFVNSGAVEVSAGAVVQVDGYNSLNSFEAGGSITGAGAFVLAANMTVNSDQSVGVATFVLDYYYGLSGTGTLSFEQVLDWKGGEIGNTVVMSAGSTLNILDSGFPKYLNGALTNNGTVQCHADISVGNAALINNNGLFNLNEGASFGPSYGYSGQMNNSGVLNKNGMQTLQLGMLLNNLPGGLVQVNEGTLETGRLDNAGAVFIAPGATLAVKDGSNLAGGTLSGSGVLHILGTGWYLAASLNSSDLTLDIEGNLGGAPDATLTISGLANWISGEIGVASTVDAGATLNIQGYGYRTLSAQLTNEGTVNLSSSFIAYGDIVNNGLFNLSGDGGSFYGSADHVFTNNGTLHQASSYSSTIGLTAVNNGAISIDSAPLFFYNGFDNNNIITIAAGASLNLNGASSFNAGGSVTGAGSIATSGGLSLAVNFSFEGEMFTLSGDLTGPGELQIGSAMTWDGGHIQTNVDIDAGATLVIGYNGGGNNSKQVKQVAPPVDPTQATMAPAPTALMSSYGQMLSAVLTNNGTVDQMTDYQMSGGSFINNGQFNTSYGGIYDGGNGGTLTNNGNWTLNGDFYCYVSAANNGTLKGNANTLLFDPAWENNGAVSPGMSPGSIHFAYSYENGAQLDIEVENSDGPGYGHDYVEAQDNIQLSGSLNVSETGSPLDGEYVILHCNGGPDCLTGTFQNADLPGDYTLSYTGNEVILVKGQPASIYPADTLVCAGNGVTLTVSAGESYQWSTGETTQSILVYPYQTQTYYVTVTNSGGGGSLGSAVVQVAPQPYLSVDPWYGMVCQGESLTITAYTDASSFEWSTGETGSSITVSPDTDTNYYVTVTNVAGCTNSGGSTVYANPDPPATPVITGVPALICQNDYDIYLPTYQDGISGYWTGPGVYYGYYFSPYGLLGPQILTFTPYSGQCALPAEWVIEVTGGVFYEDADGDGYGNAAVSQNTCTQPAGYVADNTDCNDNNPDQHPGATEICNGVDDNCDGQIDEALGTMWYADTDGDGYGDPANSQTACTAPAGYVSDNSDCNDGNAAVHPGATELCNNLDDNCDGQIDEGVQATFYADADGDGYGNAAVSMQACAAPVGYVSDNTDCNDGNAAIHPGATEVCNGLDDDCNGQVDEGVQTTFYADADGDGYGNAAVSMQACVAPAGYVSDPTDCNDGNAAIHPGAPEVCNNLDDNCDGQIDEGLGVSWYLDVDGDGYGGTAYILVACMQPDGYAAAGDDCDDNNPNVHPGLPEVCNGLDDDCDGLIDDADPDVTGQPVWYADADGDGFGNAAATVLACSQPAGYVPDHTDCNDNDAEIYPGAPERCNGLDDDCDGQIDEGVQTIFYADADGDGYGNAAISMLACTAPAGFVSDNTDCNDANSAIFPGAVELCNGLDDDCDGQIDENLGLAWYADADGDGYGNPSNSTTACTAPAGYVANNTDCDDSNAAIHPGALELCNGLDDDCDGLTDEGGLCDQDGDGYTSGQGDCDDTNAAIHPGAPELCDGLDNDCDGLTDENGIVIDPILVTNIACAGGNSGAINIEVSGGAPPYVYHWSNGKTTQDISNLPAGAYTVTVTGGGCGATASATVNPRLRLVTTKTNVVCNGGNDGTATAVITGGTAPYNVLWSNGATTNTIENLSPGYYIVVVSDATGCVRTATVYIGQPPAIGISGLIQQVSCNGDNNGAIDISLSNGTAPFTYLWTDGATTGDRGGLAAGTYGLTVTDANGCSRQKSFTVTQPSALTLSFVIQNVDCNGASNGELKATAGGGTKLPLSSLCNGERYCYNWSNGANTRTISGLAPGVYTVTVTDANGCSIVGTASVTEPAPLLIAGINQELLSNGKYRLTVSATGGTTPYKYKRSPGGGFQSSNVFNNVPVGSYVVTVRDKNGCESSMSINVPTGGGSREQVIASNGQAVPSGDVPESAGREADLHPAFTLYPNPADKLCYLRAGQSFEQGRVLVTDAGGRLVLEQELDPRQDIYVFDLSGWSAGLYWMRLETDGETTVRRLLVMRN